MRHRFSTVDLCPMGERIRSLRQGQGLSQEEVARKSDLSTSLIGHIERGEKPLSLLTAMKLSRIFSVSLDHLIWGRADTICDRKNCPLYNDIVHLISQYTHQQGSAERES